MRVFFLLLPWLELFTLIQLGIETSALTALGYVFLTFLAGLFVLRIQGMGMFPDSLLQYNDGIKVSSTKVSVSTVTVSRPTSRSTSARTPGTPV